MTGLSQAGGRCPVEEDIVAYLRDELELLEKEKIDKHLAGCSLCHANAESFRETIRELERPGEPPLSCDLTSAILARFPQETWNRDQPSPFRKTPFLRLLLRMAAGLVIAVGIGYVTRHSWLSPRSGQARAREQGLLWLVHAQEKSGQWDPVQWGGEREYTVGLTGMALLSVVRSGDDLPGREKSIEQAVAFLLKQQAQSGRLGDEFAGTMYNHGIASVALLEAYNSTRDPDLVKPIEEALAFMRTRQLRSGGWGYKRGSSESANTSISVWPLQALLLAARMGLEDADRALERGLAWLVTVVDHRGQFGYAQLQQRPEGSNALTAMGAYCVLKAVNEGVQINPEIRGKIEMALARQSGEETQKTDFYRTYFQVCALKEAHADKWVESLAALRDDLVSSRQQSGPNEGSWNPEDQWGSVGGRIYSTALASLSLERR